MTAKCFMSCISVRAVLCILVFNTALFELHAQHVIWADEFENGCGFGCYASSYTTGVNGAWGVTNVTPAGACANQWFISCRENGNAVGTCGSGCGSNETLHIANELSSVCGSPSGCFFCPAGDCGAAYDAGCSGFCFCSTLSTQTNKRVQSPVIDLSSWSSITLTFKYIENGQGTTDNFLLEYFNGAVWAALSDPPKSVNTGCFGQGRWTQYSVALPASANNNANVRIGFRWQNNNDAVGADPSVAIDDVQLTVPYAPTCIGPLVNELSNGPSGEKEYIELLVCGPSCSTVDLRNWIVDDNNGVTWNGFSTVMVNGGVSTGHIRFANVAQWAAVPTGSLIVIYNNSDMNAALPPNDPSDTSPVDSIYVLPANSTLLQRCNTAPNAVTTGGYVPCTYSAGGSWLNTGFRNDGDAAQTRYPDGRYFHGVSYGPNSQNMNTGGIENMRVSVLNHLGRVIYFNAVDPRVAVNFTSATVAGNETPGASNNAANNMYRRALQCSTLPIELMSFTAENDGPTVLLEWITATERDNAYFTVERSADLAEWSVVFTTPGAGNSIGVLDYKGHDVSPLPGSSYYRLRQTDHDGTSALSNVLAVQRTNASNSLRAYVEVDGTIVLEHPCAEAHWWVYDMLGRSLADGITSGGTMTRIALPQSSSGVVSLRVRCGEELVSVRLVR